MRNFLILFVMLFSIGAFSETSAQVPCNCGPPPSTLETITTTYFDGINSCSITITYCSLKNGKLSTTGQPIRDFMICSISFPTGCTLTVDLSSSTFWDDMMELVIRNDAASIDPSLIPDCGSQSNYWNLYYEVTKAKCWILENDPVQEMYVFTPCAGETATCMKKFAVCFNAIGALEIQELQTNIVGTSNCYYEGGIFLDPETFPFDECFDTCY